MLLRIMSCQYLIFITVWWFWLLYTSYLRKTLRSHSHDKIDSIWFYNCHHGNV